MNDTGNDTETLVPQSAIEGPALAFDFPGVEIGVAEYPRGPTGATVIRFAKRASLEIDRRGGGVIMVGDYGTTDAICLAGGSVLGLEASMGVAQALHIAQGRTTGFDELALVSGAIIYDFGYRRNAIYPDKALGTAAFAAARPGWFPQGARGAGMSATVGNAAPLTPYGWETSGQGAAFRQYGETKVLAISVVNALGGIFDRDGKLVRGFLHGETGERHPLHELMVERLEHEGVEVANTTLTVIVTNQKLDHFTQGQIARQVHVAMGRMIRPFHTIYDGDVLFMVSTEEVDNPRIGPITLGEFAADTLWDAVLAAIPPDHS